MVSMVISSLVIAGVYGVYTIQQRSYTVQEQVSEMQQRIRAAVDFMSREMRVAGYDPPEPYDPGNACQGATITQADMTATPSNPQFFAFSYCDVTASSNTPPITYTSRIRTSRYQLENRALGLLRDNDKSATTIAEGVDAIEFQYRGRGGTVLPAPVANPRDVHAVDISMLVRSTYPDMKHTDTVLYLPRSKDRTWNGTFNVNPPNDNFHRRLLVTTVYLRNMGVQE